MQESIRNLRATIINLLDDEDGVNEKGFIGLSSICVDNNWQDIIRLADSAGGRFFLLEKDAETLRNSLRQ